MPKKTYSTINIFLRSSLFLIYSSITIAIYGLICVASFPAPLRFRHALVRNFLRFYFYMLKVICHLDYRIEGIENIPKDRYGILMCKHSSSWETYFLPQYFHTPAIIAKRELAWVPFFGWGLSLMDPIYIDRRKRRSAMQQLIEKGKRCLKAGRWIMIFPEGTRVPYGTIGHYKMGGARLAAETGYPILPIAHNAGKFWPRRKFLKQPGTITVVIGPLIESKGRRGEQLLEETKSWIEDTMKRL